jgi:hypothetical protein
MLVSEALIRKDDIKKRIEELEFYIGLIDSDSEMYTSTLNTIFELIDKFQSYFILITRHNNNTKLKVGDAEVTIQDAVILRKTVEDKMNILTNIINKPDSGINVLGIMEQRDKLMEEYILLNSAIEKSDRSSEIE